MEYNYYVTYMKTGLLGGPTTGFRLYKMPNPDAGLMDFIRLLRKEYSTSYGLILLSWQKLDRILTDEEVKELEEQKPVLSNGIF